MTAFKQPPQIDPFHAISLSRRAYEMEAEARANGGRAIIHLEFGQPSCGAPAAAIAAAHRVLDTDPMGYWESSALKQRLIRHYAKAYGVSITADQIILTCGASPAFVLALNCLFAPGDRIALARPGYVAYRNSLKALHLTPVEIETGVAERFQMTAKALAAIEPAPDGVILASPANPTGTIIPAEELRAIVAICAERGISIVSDEIYHRLVYEGAAHSLLEFSPDALIVNSFSKYYAMPGWRLGWLIVPPALADAAYARMGNLFLTPPVASQHAALAAFDCDEELGKHVKAYAANRALLLERLPALGLKQIAPPDGAFYIYADIGHLTDNSMAFCLKMLEDTGVATAPGIDFDPERGNRFMRFSFAVSTAEVEEALARLTPWFAAQ